MQIVGLMPPSLFISSPQQVAVGSELLVVRGGKEIATLKVSKVSANSAQGATGWVIEAKIVSKTSPVTLADEVRLAGPSFAIPPAQPGESAAATGPPAKVDAAEIQELHKALRTLVSELALVKEMVQQQQEAREKPKAPSSLKTEPSAPPAGSQAEASGKPRIAVISFAAPGMSYSAEEIEDILLSHIEAEIGRTGRFSVVNRSRLDQVLQEQRLSLSGFIDPSTAVRVGQLVGAKGLVYGQIVRADVETSTDKNGKVHKTAKVGLSASIVDAETGALLASEVVEGADYQGNLPDAFLDAAKQLARRISTAFPVETYLVTGGSDKVIIKGGEDVGLMVGWHLDVARGAQPVVDPVTGQVLSTARNIIGQVRITKVGPTTSEGIVVAGKNLNPGDLLISTRKISGFDPNMKLYLAVGLHGFNGAPGSFEPALGAILDYSLAKGRKVFVKPMATLQVDIVPIKEQGWQIDVIPVRGSWGLAFGGLTPRLYAGGGLTYIIAKWKNKEYGVDLEDNAFGFHLGGRFFFSEKLFLSGIYTMAKSDLGVDYGGFTFTATYKFK